MTKYILLAAVTALYAAASTFTGVITESMCVKDHKAMKMGVDAECVRACVKADKNVKYVLFDGKNMYKLSDQETPAAFAARKVSVTGTLYPKTGIISVEKIQAAQ